MNDAPCFYAAAKKSLRQKGLTQLNIVHVNPNYIIDNQILKKTGLTQEMRFLFSLAIV
jgi:hypothetical protein